MKRYTPLFLLSVIIFTGCGGGGGWGAGGWSMPPMPVETETVAARRVADQFSTVGSIEADQAVTIVSEIGGIVESIPFEEGSAVSRGSLIARLDDRELKADFERASALRDQSQASYNRVKVVVEAGAGAPQDLDDASAALKVAEANVASAKARLDKTRITAPFDGLAGARRVSTGTYLRPGDPITDMATVIELRVIFFVPERYLAELKRGSEVTVTTTAFPGYDLTGKIDVIEPVIDPGTRSTRVVARVKNPDRKFRPGMSANVTAVLTEHGDALAISNEAVFMDQNQAFVYVINPDSSVKKTPVQLGTRMIDAVEVASGLKTGDRIVKAGHQKIFEGGKVIPISSQDSTMVKDTTAAAAGAQR